MERLRFQRGIEKAKFTRIETFLNTATQLAEETSDDQYPLEEYIDRLETLESAYVDFNVVQDKIMALLDPAVKEQTDDYTAYSELIEETYRSLKMRLKRWISSFDGEVESRRDSINSNLNAESLITRLIEQQTVMLDQLSFNRNNNPYSKIHLKPLKIPEFGGDYTAWRSFCDIFTNAVHNNQQLSNVQRLHHLKESLTGEAAALIKHITITDANYQSAWELLNNRYDKKNHIVQSLLKTFIDQPKSNQLSASHLRKIISTSNEVIHSLTALGPDYESRDCWLIYLLLDKLDSDTRKYWAENKTSENPNFCEFITTIEKKCDAMETCQLIDRRSTANTSTNSRASTHIIKSFISSTENQPSCCYCSNGSHQMAHCHDFKAASITSRRNFVKDKQLCFNCLQNTHSVTVCKNRISCHICRRRHHSLLHLPADRSSFHQSSSSNRAPSKPTTSSSSQSLPAQSQTSTTTSERRATTPDTAEVITLTSNLRLDDNLGERSVLPTLIVKAKDSRGQFQTIRALLDSGSNSSLISEDCMQLLGLSRKNARVSVNGMSDVNIGVARGITDLEIFSRYNPKNSLKLKPYIMNKLSSAIPSVEFNKSQWANIQDLELADPEFNKVNKIDLIIGWGKFMSIFRKGEIVDSSGEIIAKNTKFGYIICGELKVSQPINTFCTISSPQNSMEDNCDVLIQKFWETEEIPQVKPLSAEEKFCEDHFNSTHSRNEQGRYVVRLPLKQEVKDLGNSKLSAMSRFHAMELKGMRDSEYKNQYTHFMTEYQELDHMRPVPKEEVVVDSQKSFYLPHHAVIKDSSSTTKLRVVFDGSSKTTSGISLNDKLAVGPTIQDDIISIMLRFRSHSIVLKADVEKMYRQILVSPLDQDYQRILWRSQLAQEYQHFRLQTVTYGTGSAPFLATRALKQLSEDNKQQYPDTSVIIGRDFYVDDLMTGCQTIQEAIELQKELDKICLSGGFKLRKWASNSSEVLSSIPSSEREIQPFEINVDSSVIKTLGIFWSPFIDSFSFQVNLPPVTHLTKRSLLSDSSKLFDPFGWISPTIIQIKIMFQKLWLLDITWDDPLPISIADEWLSIRNSLSTLMDVKLSRIIPNFQGEILLCGFCDASESAMAAVVYARAVINEEVLVNIVAGKTKVAPLKKMSIPKLELGAAVLLAKLLEKITSSLTHLSVKSLAFTDSTIVLSWLSAPPHKWNTFVANRTSDIFQRCPSIVWDHVSSKENPADCASRGISAQELVCHSLWWTGPSWLKNCQTTWISKKNSLCDIENAPESKKSALINLNIQVAPDEDCRFRKLLSEKSNLSTILRATAFCLRFVSNCSSSSNSINGFLTTRELTLARNVYLKAAQKESYADIMQHCIKDTPITGNSQMRKLHPFIDRDGLLRVGGRLENSDLSFNTKHPIIISAASRITHLIVEAYHVRYMHAGVKLLTSILFQEYWILGHRSLVRKIIHNCIICFKQKSSTSRQLMGSLPATRVTPSRVFSQVGCDFAGPFLVRRNKGRGGVVDKAYIALYICLSTKAIHLELASDLSTNAYIATLKRFTARRGVPGDIFCDNGTNFVGARRQLNDFQHLFKQQQQQELISKFSTNIGVNFHFNPPSAPHMGGIWEAGVKAVKTHLKKVLTEARLTFEEFSTVLCQVEACVNSRPLCELTADGLDVLTPAHFLIGQPMTTVPEPTMEHITTNRLNRWQYLTKLINGFWKKWQHNYLLTLQPREKWSKIENNLVVNDLVLIHEKNMSATQWARGRVITCHPGTDGLVRVVTLKTQRGTMQRPVHKLSVLPKLS